MPGHVSLIVDMRRYRCGDCEMAILNHLARECPGCRSGFECIQSNHAGLAFSSEYYRAAAGAMHSWVAVAD